MNEPKCPKCCKPLSLELGTYYCHWCKLIIDPSVLQPEQEEQMAKCTDCIHHFVCETLKGKTEDTWAERCVSYRHKESCAEVVRCKDCKWLQQDGVNRNFCGLGDFYCGETDYCSRGAKMDVD